MARVRRSKSDSLVPSPRELSKQLNRSALKHIYDEAKRAGRIPTPDAAMEALHSHNRQRIGDTDKEAKEVFPPEMARFDVSQVFRDAHHIAVDLYYRALYPRKGAPPLRHEYKEQLLRWQSGGLRPRQIAIKLGLGSSKEKEDLVRKQLLIAKGRRGKN